MRKPKENAGKEEKRYLDGLSIGVVEGSQERAEWDRLMERDHYLGNANLVGECLRYVVRDGEGQWVALIGWNSAAYHLRARDHWIGWSQEQRKRRLKFVAQNSRFLLLVPRKRFPNLASRALSLSLRRLREDWLYYFGHPVVIAESFIDPQRFKGTAYKAAGWKRLGGTGGYRRCYSDFYVDLDHPKELWVYRLHNKGPRWLRAETLPERLRPYEEESNPSCPYSAAQLAGLWTLFNQGLSDRRAKRGQRHLFATVLSITAVATLTGEKGPKGFAEFAQYLSQPQRRRLRCRRKNGQFDVPSEATFRRIFKQIETDRLTAVIAQWQEQIEGIPRGCIAVDGKTLRGSRRRDGRQEHVLSAVTHDTGRLLNQRAIAERSNEITAFEPLLAPLPLAGTIITADAEHTQRSAAQFLTQTKQADYFFILKDNQPKARQKAEQLLGTRSSPDAESWDKGHGRIEHRQLWAVAISPAEVGFCGAAQLVRIRRLRWEGQCQEPSIQEEYAVTSLTPDQADPDRLLVICRGHWSIENGTHYRRDRTFDEDRLPVREPNVASVLAAFRCLAIFHCMRQKRRRRRPEKYTLPDFQRWAERRVGTLIGWMMAAAPKGA